MKKFLAAVLAVAMLLSLYGVALAETITKEQLIGKWEMEADSLKAMVEADEELAPVSSLFSNFTFTVEFNEDGKYVMSMSGLGEEDKQEGTWMLVASFLIMDDDIQSVEYENGVLIIHDAAAPLRFQRVSDTPNGTPGQPTAAPVTEGKLSVSNEQMIYFEEYSSTHGYLFAKVENIGGRDTSVYDCYAEFFNAAGDRIAYEDYGNTYARYLKPGEYTYLRVWVYDELKEQPADYSLNVIEKPNNYYYNERFPVTAELELDVDEGWQTTDYMVAAFTNEGNELIYGINVVMALLDTEGNLLYVTEKTLYDYAVAPGSTVYVREEIPSGFQKYFQENNMTPSSVDAFAYVELTTD